MNIADYPSSIVWVSCLPIESEPGISVLRYEDGAQDYNLDGVAFARRWEIEYLLTTDDAATLDAHYAAAKGAGSTFRFRDSWTGETYADVRYLLREGYEVQDHTKHWVARRRVVLVQELT